jgi:hypothetical protein
LRGSPHWLSAQATGDSKVDAGTTFASILKRCERATKIASPQLDPSGPRDLAWTLRNRGALSNFSNQKKPPGKLHFKAAVNPVNI